MVKAENGAVRGGTSASSTSASQQGDLVPSRREHPFGVRGRGASVPGVSLAGSLNPWLLANSAPGWMSGFQQCRGVVSADVAEGEALAVGLEDAALQE